jgi:ABC-type transport system involved in cytochrome c biogenesis ATPase subunit
MHPVTPAGVLAGRDDELALLNGLLRDLAPGSGNAVPIEGEPGIGKTALIRAPLGFHAPRGRLGLPGAVRSSGMPGTSSARSCRSCRSSTRSR